MADERARFRELQAGFAKAWSGLAADPKAPRTVVVLPSLSLDAEVMTRISGVHHYEERMLCMLLLLRLPRTRLVFVSSQPVADSTIEYYLSLLPSVPHTRAGAAAPDMLPRRHAASARRQVVKPAATGRAHP